MLVLAGWSGVPYPIKSGRWFADASLVAAREKKRERDYGQVGLISHGIVRMRERMQSMVSVRCAHFMLWKKSKCRCKDFGN